MDNVARNPFQETAVSVDKTKSGSQNNPNVLFISFDDLNHYVGFLGRHPDAVSPNMNRLAERSVVFERAYCQAPICNPSRASLMTGLRPSTTGIYNNRQPVRFSERGCDAVTLPQHFRKSGYRATGSGKVFHGKFPDPMSWDDYLPSPWNQGHGGASPAHRPLNGMADMGNVDWGPLDVEDSEMSDAMAVDACIDILKEKHDRPFFLTCGLTTTHLTWVTPQNHYEKFDPECIALPEIEPDDLDDVAEIGRRWANRGVHARLRDEGRWREAIAAYLACIHFADAQVGRLIDALERSPYADNTVIVLWSDHGWHLGEKEHWKKSTLWEEGTRVPLLISAPGVSPGRCRKPVGLIDLYPTLIELCGLPARDNLEGLSLMPLLQNPDRMWDRPAVSTHGRGNHAVRSERWRYIRYHDGSEELYNHDSDEFEWHNRAGDPELRDVKEELARWLPEENAEDSEVVAWPEQSDEYRKRIESLL